MARGLLAMEFPAELEYLPEMLGFILEVTKSYGVSKGSLRKLELAAEEALVNIISYAYPEDREKKIWIECQQPLPSQVEILLKDRGAPFNPLEHTSDAETQLNKPAEERKVGGLGVFLLQKMVDGLKYERKGEENRLILIVQI